MQRSRFLQRVLALSFALALVSTPAALAQTGGYPGTTTPPTTAAPTTADFDIGNLEPGAVVNLDVCNWQPGTTVNVRNSATGSTIVTLVADARGCIRLTIEVLRQLVAAGLLNSVLHPMAATRVAATADKVQVRVNGVTFTAGPYGTPVTLIASGVGANGAPRTVSVRFTVVKPGTTTRSGLVRTGTTVIKFAPLGAGLLGLGYLLVLATRRRRTTSPA
jgi:hypothetical protein